MAASGSAPATAARSSSAGCSSGSRRKRLILDFYPGTDAEHPTEVVVRFAQENGGTRVVVQHRPKPESADLWAPALRASSAPGHSSCPRSSRPPRTTSGNDRVTLPSVTPTAARDANE